MHRLLAQGPSILPLVLMWDPLYSDLPRSFGRRLVQADKAVALTQVRAMSDKVAQVVCHRLALPDLHHLDKTQVLTVSRLAPQLVPRGELLNLEDGS